MDHKPVARITHYYNKIGVAVLALSDTLAVGDAIHIAGYTTDFCQPVKSLQINHRPVAEAYPGDDVALQVLDRVRAGDEVFRISGEDALDFLSKRADVSTTFA